MVAELIPVVDLRLLTQSELATLALSSPNAYDLYRCDDVVVPKIDRSVFNESAGSRKQTYSRLRLDPPKSDCPSDSPPLPRRRGRPRSIPLRATPTAASATPSCAQPASDDSENDPDRRENLLIASFLRQLFSREDPSFQTLALDKDVSTVSVNEKNDNWRNILAVAEEAQKTLVLSDDGDQETLNSKGVPVDLVALGQMEDPFGEELRSKTDGLRTEDLLLAFLSGIEGQWGSRRRRRRFVDASLFGDILPRGWKLLLGLKRKEGIAWLDCRRYVSPNGYQFASCKEVSLYILSLQGVTQPSHDRTDNTAPLSDKGTYDSIADQIYHNAAISNGSSSFSSPASVSYFSGNQVKQPDGNSCYDATPISYISCENEKRQLLFSHRRAKRRRHGKTIVDGVILKDGKYICQFCHKVFTERHRYNGHIGAHVRYQGLTAETMIDESCARKFVNQSSWAVVPYNSSNNDGSNMKVASHTTQLVTQLNDSLTMEGQMEISTSKPSDGARLEEILEEGIATEIKHVECIDCSVPSKSDLTSVPQDCFPRITKEEPTPTKPVDSEVSEFDVSCSNNEGFEEAKPNAPSDAVPLFSADPHIDIKATVATSLSTFISGSLSMSPVHLHENDAPCQLNNRKNIPSSPSKPEDGVSPYLENVDDSACNADEVLNSPCTSKTFDGIPLAASDADNMEYTFNDRALSSSPTKADVIEKSDFNSINYTSENVVCTSDYMDEDNSCFDLSLSLMEIDVKAKDKNTGINHHPSNLASEFEKYNNKLAVDVENNSFSLSGNNSSNGCETYAEDISVHAVEEHFVKPGEGQDAGECFRPLFDKNAVLMSSMHDTLQNSSIMVSFGGKTQDIRENTDCAFDTDINESLLQEIDKPVNELEFFFDGSSSIHDGSAADEMISNDSANEAVHISLSNSSWIRATNALPILDMLPEQCGVEISQKNGNLQAFDDLRLGAIEPSDFALFTGPDSRTVIGPSMSLGYASELEDQQCSFQLGWNISLGNIDNASSFTSVCVWCNTEFRHEHSNNESHSETLGFICPSCKEKFSGP